ERTMAAHTTYFPSDFVLPTFIDNHDMDRFLYIAGGDTGRLREAAAFLMALPNPPIVYYGTEVGLSQTTSVREEGGGLHISRAPMPWGDAQDRDLLAYYADLIRARRSRG
ncbi:MAG: alpha-amylase family glycosyl hydrolase, partial [bacterium]|nr:alpha-amylase family glycosyl hydrolase [bacterium]